MAVALFAGIPVRDYARARAWYERFFGCEPTFVAHATECVWELAEQRSVYIEEEPEHAGHARVTVFLEEPGELEELVAAVAARGIAPTLDETYGNGVRKVTFTDEDGNQVGYGGASA